MEIDRRGPMSNLTLEEAAAHLGLTPDQLRTFASNGDVPDALLGPRGWRFRRDTIEALAALRS
jgi:MerR HTH family regulatory protein